MHRLLTTTSAAILLLSSAVQAQSVELAYKQEPGTAVRKEWTTVQKLRLATLFARVGEQRLPGELDMSLESTRTIVATDHVRALREDGLPADLRRSFDTVGRLTKVRFGDQVGRPLEQSSSLSGTSVVYQWIPGEEGYGRHFDAVEGLEIDLAKLEEDMDLRQLLPEGGAAEIGTSWTVPADRLGGVIAPGGAIVMQDVPMYDKQTQRSLRGGIGGCTFRVFQDCAHRGDLKVTLVGLEGDGQLARLSLEANLRVVSDQGEFVGSNATPVEKRRDLVYESADLLFEFVGRGHCLWNIAEGRAHSFEIQGSQTCSLDLNIVDKTEETPRRGGQYIQMNGSFAIGLVTEVVEAPEVPNASSTMEGKSDAGGGKKQR